MTSSAALLREHVQSSLGSRYETVFLPKKRPEDTLSSVVGDVPRGAITEISGARSTGRTSLLHSLLAVSCAVPEYCALLDANDTFDLESAQSAGVRLSQVLWVRCGGNVESAIKAADMLAQGGGFGLIAIDLGEASDKTLNNVPIAVWFRLRHAVENTRTALVVLARKIHAHPCSALKIELSQSETLWKGQLAGCLLDGFAATAHTVRNHKVQNRPFRVEP